ncbi:mechanosensitive ion channel domain-containing protein [uncultured Ruegeria sp.]|uniref:mechanosensitive ion channel family protein n=1 Tax=uncultured Ruegeria sp. TaxID=259304 RepID=UPI002638EDB2|nr:mechanosensitive ion channel domain-containing protein [uncultured Ruegeria sp.]
MDQNTANWPSIVQNFRDAMNQWLITIDPNALALSAAALLVVFLLRKKISDWIIGGFEALLKRFSVSLTDEVASQLKIAVQVLAVTFALFLTLDAISPPDLLAGVLNQVLGSVALVAVFATWYQLSGPFVSLLVADRVGPAAKETSWVQRVSQFAILLFGLTSLLKVWQVDISGALAGVGVLGAGMAIATQDLIRNLVAGMTNMSEQRFKTGDAIQVEGQFVGTVQRIDLRSTLVVGFDQIPRYIPNSDLSNSVVLNYSERKHRRVKVVVPLVLSSTREQIEAVRDALRLHHQNSGDFHLDAEAAQYIFVNEIGPSSVNILIYVWTKDVDYDAYLQTKERLTLAVLQAVKSSGTELAYPTQTLKFFGDPPSKSPKTDLVE